MESAGTLATSATRVIPSVSCDLRGIQLRRRYKQVVYLQYPIRSVTAPISASTVRDATQVL